MIQKFLIKAIPYIIIALLLIIGYFWISKLNTKIDSLNGIIGSQSEVIKQNEQTINNLKKDSETAQKEQEKDKEEHNQAQQELKEYNEVIENFVDTTSDQMIINLNKYNECIAKNFNNNSDCSRFLKVGVE